MKTRGLLLTILAAVFILALSACGKEGEKSRTADASPGVTKDEPSETPSPTATLSPTPSPTPTMELPKGFPEEVPLSIEMKYTTEGLEKEAEEQVKVPEDYQYRVTTRYSEQQKEVYCPGVGSFAFNYDKEEKYYEDTYDSEKPCLRVCSLNGEVIFSCFQSETLTFAEFKGKKYIKLRFSETGPDGQEYTYSFANPDISMNNRFELSVFCEWTDGQGKAFQATYGERGNLKDLKTTECDTKGRVTEQAWYQNKIVQNRRFFIQERTAFVYGEDGNIVHKESYRIGESETTTDYTYEKDDRGRVCAYVESFCKKGESPQKRYFEIYYPTEDTILYLYYNGETKEAANGYLIYVGEQERERIMNGICFVDAWDLYNREGCYLLSDGSVDLSVTDKLVYSFPWFEYEYKNGHLVKARAYVSGAGSEDADYEYDSVGRLIRKHEYTDVIGDRILSYSYDSNGRLVREEITETACYIMNYWETDDRAMNVTELTVYSYYDNGMLAKKERTVTYRKDSSATEYRREVETYDEDGFLVQSVKQYLENDVVKTAESVGEWIR
ncbi:MAG: hypothetical protein K6F26_05955 [Lachnospiraceae bacterium]|nr:hypothetical protein [Lachnospiraceae bacterium]